MNKAIKEKKRRGQGIEAMRVANKLNNYSVDNSKALHWIQGKYGTSLSHRELRSIAQLLCQVIPGLKLSREAVRDNKVLIKWYDDNWGEIQPRMDNIRILDNENIPITADRENSEKIAKGRRPPL